METKNKMKPKQTFQFGHFSWKQNEEEMGNSEIPNAVCNCSHSHSLWLRTQLGDGGGAGWDLIIHLSELAQTHN